MKGKRLQHLQMKNQGVSARNTNIWPILKTRYNWHSKTKDVSARNTDIWPLLKTMYNWHSKTKDFDCKESLPIIHAIVYNHQRQHKQVTYIGHITSNYWRVVGYKIKRENFILHIFCKACISWNTRKTINWNNNQRSNHLSSTDTTHILKIWAP